MLMKYLQQIVYFYCLRFKANLHLHCLPAESFDVDMLLDVAPAPVPNIECDFW